MSPQKVKIVFQCILTSIFISLCIISFNNLLKADTSLAFSKDNSAYFPSLTICPLKKGMSEMNSFDDLSKLSIRDYLSIQLIKKAKNSRETVNIIGNHLQFTVDILLLDSGSLFLKNCTTAILDLDNHVQGGSGSYVNVELEPNPHFRQFSISFHEQGVLEQNNLQIYGDSKLFVNFNLFL